MVGCIIILTCYTHICTIFQNRKHFVMTHKFSKNSCNLDWMNDEGFTTASFLSIMSFKCQLSQQGVKQKQYKTLIPSVFKRWFFQKEHVKIASWCSQLTIKALRTNSSSFWDRYEMTGLRSWGNQIIDSITNVSKEDSLVCRTIIINRHARFSKIQDCTSHKLSGENSLEVSEKADEQHICHLLGAALDNIAVENPSRSMISSASSGYESTILKASHACQFARLIGNLISNKDEI